MATAGTVTIRLDGDSATLIRELNKANEHSKATFAAIKREAADVAAKFAVIGTAAAAGFTALAKSSFESIDALAKTAERLDVTTGALKTLQVAAELAGVSKEQLTKSLQKQQKVLADAANGSAAAAQSIRQLGLDTARLMAMPADQQFEQIANALGNVDNVTRRNALAMEIWGSRAAEMVNLAVSGRRNLAELAGILEDLNVKTNDFDAQKIVQANDAVFMAKRAFEGLGNTIAVAVAPYVTALADQFTDSARAANGFKSEVDTAMQYTAKAVGFAADAVLGIKLAFLGAASGALQLSAWGAKALSLFSGEGPMRDFARNAEGAAAELRLEIEEALNSKLPSQAVDEWFAHARAQADVLAAQMLLKPKRKDDDSIGAADAGFAADAEAAKRFAALEKQMAPKIVMPEIEVPRFPLMDPEWVREQTQVSAEQYLEQWRLANEQRRIAEGELRALIFAGEEQAGAAIIEMAARHARQKVAAEFAARGEAMGENGEFLDPQAQIAFEMQVQEETLAMQAEYLNRRLALQQQFGGQFLGIQKMITALFGKQWADAHKQTLADTAKFASAALSITQSLFGENKKVAIATAIVSTLTGAANALKDLKFPANIAAAAQVLATGMAQVQQIRSTNIGGGGIGGGIGGGLATAPTAQPISNPLNDSDQNRRSAIQVHLHGDIYGWDDYVRERIAGSLREMVDGNDVILFGADSRQAAEIRGGG